ncbi:MAG: cyclic nucleotide-binding domain-containing protein [Myxococcales bacterium]|jgi:CRP/FNR family cyclic AMP-dependent transcriptional regulator|nr:cyclic nucleotide-binding domain-containing protein [Myxococcales bacterium]
MAVTVSLDMILFLKDVSLFESLSNAQLAEVARLAERVDVTGDDINKPLFYQGEPADCLYLIRKGRVRVIQNGHEIARLGPGETTGEMAVLAGIERSATIEPIEPMVLLRFDADDFLALLDTYPEIQRALMRTLVMRLTSANRPREPSRRAATMVGMVWGKDGAPQKPTSGDSKK